MEVNRINFFDTLPQEMLEHIFSFLKPKDLGSVARVCNLWNNVSSEDILWKNQCLDEVGKFPSAHHKEKFRDAYHFIHFIIQNENSESASVLDRVWKKIISKELVDSLRDPQIEMNQKLKLIKNYFSKIDLTPLKDEGVVNLLSLKTPKSQVNPNKKEEPETPPYLVTIAYDNVRCRSFSLIRDPSLKVFSSRSALDLAVHFFEGHPDYPKVIAIKDLFDKLNRKLGGV